MAHVAELQCDSDVIILRSRGGSKSDWIQSGVALRLPPHCKALCYYFEKDD